MNNDLHPGMSPIVRTVTRLTVGLILLYGLYIVLHGHITPGGGFAGGVIIALGLVHLTLAFGKGNTLGRISDPGIKRAECLGALLFLALAFAGFAGGAFFLNLLPKGEFAALLSAGCAPVFNIAICLKVGAGLFAVFLALTIIQPEEEEKP